MNPLIETFLISMVPVIELRGAIPFALARGVPVIPAVCAAMLGNLLPVPFILLFIRKILEWMKKRGGRLRKIARWVERREAHDQGSERRVLGTGGLRGRSAARNGSVDGLADRRDAGAVAAAGTAGHCAGRASGRCGGGTGDHRRADRTGVKVAMEEG